MSKHFSLTQLRYRYPDDSSCLEDIKRLKFPDGVHCQKCKRITEHYKLVKRAAYTCKFCRSQVYPLVGTIFEKTTTPLRLWFIALYLMTQTRGNISAKQLQRELGVTYKTAWRMRLRILRVMEADAAHKLNGFFDFQDPENNQDSTVRRWSFFNTIEITFVQKEEKT